MELSGGYHVQIYERVWMAAGRCHGTYGWAAWNSRCVVCALILSNPPPVSPVQVVARDLLHRYIVKGYGSVAVPTSPGSYVRDIRTFAPVATSKLQEVAAFFTGNYPQVR